MAKTRSVPPKGLNPPPLPTKRKSLIPTARPAPTARRAPDPVTVPMRTLSLNDVYLHALYAEARLLAKLEFGTYNVRFTDDKMGANLLVALQEHPKPNDAYLITLPTESGGSQSFEVVLMPNYVFRVTFKKP